MAEEKKKKLKVLGEFKKFITRGNVLDMAVGLVMGSAFTAIVNSVVGDLLMPLLGMLTGQVNFSDLKIVLQEAVKENGEEVVSEVSVNYGAFIESIINFLLISVAVFIMVKAINTLRDKLEHKKKAEEEAPPEPDPNPQIALLTEIRDLLKKESDEKDNASSEQTYIS